MDGELRQALRLPVPQVLLTLGGNVTINNAGTGNSGASISSPLALGNNRIFTVADDGTAAADLTLSNLVTDQVSALQKQGQAKWSCQQANTFYRLL
jgi:hypothetical protein